MIYLSQFMARLHMEIKLFSYDLSSRTCFDVATVVIEEHCHLILVHMTL